MATQNGKGRAATRIAYRSGGAALLPAVGQMRRDLMKYIAAVCPRFAEDFSSGLVIERGRAHMRKAARRGGLRVDLADERVSGETIGYCVSTVDENGTGEIYSLFVEERFRGQRVGDALMRRALAWMGRKRVNRKVISVALGNERVLPFYARFGFYPRMIQLEQPPKPAGN